jgi:hypothetical protein
MHKSRRDNLSNIDTFTSEESDELLAVIQRRLIGSPRQKLGQMIAMGQVRGDIHAQDNP